MKTLYWDSGDPLDCFDNPNCRWGDPSYRLEPGDSGYLPWFPPGYTPPPNRPMQQDDIDITITPEQEAAIIAKIGELRTLINAFAVSLSAEDSARYFKLGDNRMAFDDKCDDYIHQRADLVPPTVDVPAYDRDGAASAAVKRIAAAFHTITESLDDTDIVLGADRLSADLAFYNYLPLAAKAKAVGAEDIYNELKAIFPGGRRRSNPTPSGSSNP